MLPFGIGFSEVLLILVVVLLVVGPQKLPEIARTLGKGIRMARRAGNELRDVMDMDDIRRSVYDNTVRPWQQGVDVEDAEVDERGTYARAAAEVSAATAAAVDGVDLSKPGDAAEEDDEMHDPDEDVPSGPIARPWSPTGIIRRPERPVEPVTEASDEAEAASSPEAEPQAGVEAELDSDERSS